jgi:hypothetical protein
VTTRAEDHKPSRASEDAEQNTDLGRRSPCLITAFGCDGWVQKLSWVGDRRASSHHFSSINKTVTQQNIIQTTNNPNATSYYIVCNKNSPQNRALLIEPLSLKTVLLPILDRSEAERAHHSAHHQFLHLPTIATRYRSVSRLFSRYGSNVQMRLVLKFGLTERPICFSISASVCHNQCVFAMVPSARAIKVRPHSKHKFSPEEDERFTRSLRSTVGQTGKRLLQNSAHTTAVSAASAGRITSTQASPKTVGPRRKTDS